MSFTICLDPGLRVAGLAIFRGSALYRAGLLRNPERKARGVQTWALMGLEAAAFVGTHLTEGEIFGASFYAEEMVVRRQRRSNPADLLQLNGVVGAVGASLRCATRTSFPPEVWKGNLDADVMLARIRERLASEELAVLAAAGAPASLEHNVLDAIGIGLYAVNRLKRAY